MSEFVAKTVNGVIWSAIERLAVRGIQFIISIVLARLLMPSDYGLIAMLSIFLAIAQSFVDSGFSNALIQKHNRTEIDCSTVFYFNIIVGIVLYLILFFCSGPISDFYSEPRLQLIVKVSGLSIIINSFGVVQRAKLSINLNFKLQALASLAAVIISGALGIFLAYKGLGVWSLVAQSVINHLLNVCILWGVSHWHPIFVFSTESFRSLFSYGSKLLLSGLLHTIYINLYSLAIGKKMNSTDLGIYNQAYTFAYFPSSNITDILHKVMFPVLCEVQDDINQLENYFLTYLRTACYVIFPIMVGLASLAYPFVRLVLTDKWIDVVPVLQILCFAYMWDPVMRINNYFLYVKGYTSYTLKAEIFKKAIAITILILTLNYGLYIISSGLILYSFIDIFIITRYTKRISKLTLKREIYKLYPVILLSLSMGFISWGTTFFFESPHLQLSVGMLVGISYYFIASRLFKFEDYFRLKRILVNIVRK